jgi:tRNA nucleotidyltransferase (CCA-adding enzyme)
MRLDGKHYGELHDYWGGLNDLREALVRVLHSLSFVDDPTRMLRAVRFEQRFGFQIEERTLQLLREALSLLGKMTGERIRHELDHMLDEENRLLMLKRLDELGLMQAIHAGLPWDEKISRRMEKLDGVGPADVLALLPGVQAGSVLKKLAYILWLIPIRRACRQPFAVRYRPSQIDVVWHHRYLVQFHHCRPKSSQIVSTLNITLVSQYTNYLAQKMKSPVLRRYLTE